jgi:hypothetical protein
VPQRAVKDRYLKILNMEGYYDLATPYLAAWYTFDHRDLPPEYRKNISHAQYHRGNDEEVASRPLVSRLANR